MRSDVRHHAQSSVGSSRWRPDIQSLRAIAVLLVVLYHAGLPIPGGFLGVDVFFVISGYVITDLLMREMAATGSIAFRAFYSKRIRRLLPALSLVIVTTAVIASLVASPFGLQQETGKTGIGAVLMSANLVLYKSGLGYFGAAANDNPLLHTWSLSVEEQFYLLFPATLLAIWRLARTRRQLLLSMGAVVVASLGISLITSFSSSEGASALAFYSPVTRAWEFGAGAMTAVVVSRSGSQPSPRMRRLVALFGISAVLIAAMLFSETQAIPGAVAIVPVLGTAALLWVGASGWSLPWLRVRWLMWIGDRSYSWYLWHWPLIVFAYILVPEAGAILGVAMALLSLLVAALTYQWWEDPIRRRRLFADYSTSRLLVLLVSIPTMASLLLVVGAREQWGGITAIPPVAGWDAGGEGSCLSSAFEDYSPAFCTEPGGEGSVALLIGDSHAGALGEAFAYAARASGYRPMTAVLVACFAADLEVDWKPGLRDAKECASYRQRVLDLVRRERPAVVVVAQRFPLFVAYDSDEPREGWQQCFTESCLRGEAAVDAWKLGETALVRQLSKSVERVVIVSSVPEFRTDMTQRSSIADWVLGGDDTARASISGIRRDFVRADVAAASSYKGARHIDPASVLCPDTSSCFFRVGRDLTYIDSNHLSTFGARLLLPQLIKAMGDK